MTDRIVLGYFGDRAFLQSFVGTAAARGAEVVAIVFDLGGDTPLAGLRDEAIAAGAVRCHVLDVREDFARDVVMPALRTNAATDPRTSVGCLADGFVELALQSIASLEAATVRESTAIPLPWLARPLRHAAVEPAMVSLRFADSTPVELNEIPMRLTEILESLEIITGHPAIDVLDFAYRELEPLSGGLIELRVQNGRLEAMARLVAS